jgi:hypothetical protein
MLKEAENVLIDFRAVGLRGALPHQSASGKTRNVIYRVRHTVRYDSHHTLNLDDIPSDYARSRLMNVSIVRTERRHTRIRIYA